MALQKCSNQLLIKVKKICNFFFQVLLLMCSQFCLFTARNTSVVDRSCYQKLQAYVSEHSKHYPIQIGIDYNDDERSQMAEYLLRKHFVDFQSNHCNPLPIDHFQIPWELPSTETGFIFT